MRRFSGRRSFVIPMVVAGVLLTGIGTATAASSSSYRLPGRTVCPPIFTIDAGIGMNSSDQHATAAEHAPAWKKRFMRCVPTTTVPTTAPSTSTPPPSSPPGTVCTMVYPSTCNPGTVKPPKPPVPPTIVCVRAPCNPGTVKPPVVPPTLVTLPPATIRPPMSIPKCPQPVKTTNSASGVMARDGATVINCPLI